MTRVLTFLAVGFAMLVAAVAPAPAAETGQDYPTLTIGYLDMRPDVRYDEWGVHPVDIRSSTALVDRRAWGGARLGLEDLNQLSRVAKTRFALSRETVADADQMVAAIGRMKSDGVGLFLLDAPDDVVAKVAAATKDDDILLFNATATGDALRNDACQANLFHTAASESMLTDALAQYLKSKKWPRVLILQGPLPADAEMVASFKRSAQLFGLKIEDTRAFVLGNDPRAREQNDLAFLTGDADYDVVFVADAQGEFALGVPYAVLDPRPVVGASGLVPRVWHWSHLRNGAPQVHGRFERLNHRRMGGPDWGAWVAMKAIGEAVARTRAQDTDSIADYIRSDNFRVDGSKGVGLTFRPWDNQLRQPILLSTDTWITAVAPIEGFKHRTDDLDTLGYEARDTTCKF